MATSEVSDLAYISRMGRAPTVYNVVLAAGIVGAWLAMHVGCVFFWRWSALAGASSLALAAAAVAVQCWLCVGLFIVAHDCMHGSFMPGRPRANAAMGQLCLGLYGGFDYRFLRQQHFGHHRVPGTADDPDFHAPGPRSPVAWYLAFMRRYTSWRTLLFMPSVFSVECFLVGASSINVVLFWALPAILSSAQLFYFGTYRPHRHEDDSFLDRHRARSSDYNWLASLLTCFHFGYHHEHHLHPDVPWWALPAAHVRLRSPSVLTLG